MTAPASTLLQRVTGWFGGLPGKAADVLPVRLGVTEYRQSSSTPASVTDAKSSPLATICVPTRMDAFFRRNRSRMAS